MALRILDNLQVKISTLHFRFEDNVFCSTGRPYAFGVVIEAINLTTINEKGESIFIDRTDPKNKNEPLYKKLSVQGISIYWSDNPQVILSVCLTNDELDKQIDSSHKKIDDKDFLLKPCKMNK
jgi:hypothetical protein